MGREAGRTPERRKERAWGVRRARPLAWEKDEGCQVQHLLLLSFQSKCGRIQWPLIMRAIFQDGPRELHCFPLSAFGTV